MLNEGFNAAQGKYVVFLNGNDISSNNFVQTLYNIAEQIQADVIYPASYGVPQANDLNNINITTDETDLSPNQINVIDKSNLSARIQGWLNRMFYPRIYNKLIRCEFLINNNINLSADAYMPEWIFCLKCLCLAEKYVRFPQPLYVHLPEQNSQIDNDIHKMIAGIEDLDKFMSNINFFNENIEIRRSILAEYAKTFLK